MATIEEIPLGQTSCASAALLALRPRWQTAAALADFVDTRLRPVGYRLAGVLEDGQALSVIGFRDVHATAWGHYLYVDDLSTLPEARGRGHGSALLDWVFDEAGRLGCEAVHLDSGVGADRAAAHRLYLRHHMRISAHHFAAEL
ncbi:GNAT family N-acetyltransferase [Mycolicibacillus parakoreensis]|uniref:GNAT family N-acetyltransferase n=1 Tax=Mycolicibacillus parakoreensis TaxID=1069221 RepID=A0ABY3U2Q6_9MYCO|nr:GNAT family N-acetyltransferase [Mycolicibacillus parakoreensis]ULN52875.1 GNAT family N-acetyltransferase [Mycolicibacillus parakoreensis]